jgi:ABC-2 type transport system permease protein
MNFHRIKALLLRYVFLYSRSHFRLLDITFWPLMDLLVWGFTTMYMLRMQSTMSTYLTFLIGAIIFWNILYRAQQAVTVSFLEDIWSQNLLNIFVAPVRISEFIAATYVVGLVQSVLVVIMMSAFAYFAYAFNLIALPFSVIALSVNLLILGWTLGMATTALIIRWGHSAEALAWAVPFLIQPISAVFYPVSIFPAWLQPIALAIPSTYVFEGLRHVLQGKALTTTEMAMGFILNAMYMAAGAWLFTHMYNVARQKGLLAKVAS